MGRYGEALRRRLNEGLVMLRQKGCLHGGGGVSSYYSLQYSTFHLDPREFGVMLSLLRQDLFPPVAASLCCLIDDRTVFFIFIFISY